MFLEQTKGHHPRKGWIEVICGSMFSGKTEELIRRLKRAKIAKQNVEIFKPMMTFCLFKKHFKLCGKMVKIIIRRNKLY